jgi:hypothetical protein
MSNEAAWLAHHRRNDAYPSSHPADDESMNYQTIKYAKKPAIKAVPKPKPMTKKPDKKPKAEPKKSCAPSAGGHAYR